MLLVSLLAHDLQIFKFRFVQSLRHACLQKGVAGRFEQKREEEREFSAIFPGPPTSKQPLPDLGNDELLERPRN